MNTPEKQIDERKCLECNTRNCVKCALTVITPSEFRNRAWNHASKSRDRHVNGAREIAEKYYDKALELSNKGGDTSEKRGWCVCSDSADVAEIINGSVCIQSNGDVRLTDGARKGARRFLRSLLKYDFSGLSDKKILHSNPKDLVKEIIPDDKTLNGIYGRNSKKENELMFVCELSLFIEGYSMQLWMQAIHAAKDIDGDSVNSSCECKPGADRRPLIDINPQVVVFTRLDWGVPCGIK